jgi:hypothetical protein
MVEQLPKDVDVIAHPCYGVPLARFVERHTAAGWRGPVL